uniref:Uncharacterized protein n=1 Tax=Zea mays TaxID=4577 RepID=B4FEI3_MAIZE|nr:unknown [Zea mays]
MCSTCFSQTHWRIK